MQFNHFYLLTKNAQVLTVNITASSAAARSQMTYSLTVKLSSFSNWRLVHLCWTVAQNDNRIIRRLSAIPLTCYITLPFLPLHFHSQLTIMVIRCCCFSSQIVGFLGCWQFIRYRYRVTSWIWPWIWTQKTPWRYNLFILTVCIKVKTWTGHFCKMLNKRNLQR